MNFQAGIKISKKKASNVIVLIHRLSAAIVHVLVQGTAEMH